MIWDILMEVIDSIFDTMDSGKGASIMLGAAGLVGAGWWFLH
jgi:hypothetical protein